MNIRSFSDPAWLRLLATTGVVLLPGAAIGNVPPPFAMAADHHMHIESPTAVRIENSFCDRIGRDKCPEAIKPSTGADAIRALDRAGIHRGVLLSVAYMAGAPKLAEPPKQVAVETRAENAFVVREAAASCGRLVAFISVNPNSANALKEIRYWGERGGTSGLKLHLANSGFDFASPVHVKRLAAVFRAAAKAHLPIVIHMRNLKPDYGAGEVAIFLRDVLPAAGGDVVQIAHSAGWGGADEQALSALNAFADAIARDPKGTANLYFDTAVTPDLPDHEATGEAVGRYLDLMRRIGLKRFLLASDWANDVDLTAYYAKEKSRLNLTDAEWEELAGNAGPYLNEVTTPASCASAD